MQKVVAIFLKAWDPNTQHLKTEELLSAYLADGWRISSTTAAGGTSDIQGVGVWAIFTLEK
ncbi:MAG: hypothetical protein WD845_03230 [Pirellulales bacterium]